MVEKRGDKYLFIPVLIIVLLIAKSGLLGQERSIGSNIIICGADRTELYVDQLKGKSVGLVANPSSRITNTHLVDSLLSMDISVERIFCPEHGFRGQGEAGEEIVDHKDPITGISVVSIYGSKKKPTMEDLVDLDILVFDIQDVGARFYTYISTLHYIMEAAGEAGIEVMILDRPNPNGFYVAGPVRDKNHESFVGKHPVPIVHGMTIGEYGKMINGEQWLEGSIQCKLKVIPCLNYDHLSKYKLPVRPSPNLPNQESIYLYPSLCLFEGTVVSIGRGTDKPFQIFGHSEMKGDFQFKPRSIPGASLHPKLEGKLCFGKNLSQVGVSRVLSEQEIILDWVIEAYKELGSSEEFFTSYFDTLAGTKSLREQIISGWPANKIIAGWGQEVKDFKKIRKKYLLYPDFE